MDQVLVVRTNALDLIDLPTFQLRDLFPQSCWVLFDLHILSLAFCINFNLVVLDDILSLFKVYSIDQRFLVLGFIILLNSIFNKHLINGLVDKLDVDLSVYVVFDIFVNYHTIRHIFKYIPLLYHKPLDLFFGQELLLLRFCVEITQSKDDHDREKATEGVIFEDCWEEFVIFDEYQGGYVANWSNQ